MSDAPAGTVPLRRHQLEPGSTERFLTWFVTDVLPR